MGVPSSAIGILCTRRRCPSSGHSVSFIGIQTGCGRKDGPAGRAPARRPCPHTPGAPPVLARASMPAACAAEATHVPCLAFANFPMGRAAVGGRGPCAGPGARRGRDPSAPRGHPPSLGSRGLHRWRARPGRAAACPDSGDSALQRAAEWYDLREPPRRAAAGQQPAAPGAAPAPPHAPPPGRLATGPAGAPRPAERPLACPRAGRAGA